MELEETSQPNDTFDLRQYAYLLWRWAWLIGLATLLAGLSAFIVSRGQTRIYQAATTLRVNEAPANRPTDYSSVTTSQMLARTYSQMLTTKPVLEETAKRTGSALPLEKLKKAISVTPVRDTQLILVTVDSPDPALAASLANTLAQVFTEQVQADQVSRFAASKESLQKQLADLDAQMQGLTALAAAETIRTEKDRLDDKLTQYRAIYSTLLQSYEQVRLSEAQTVSSVTQVEPASAPLRPIRPKVLQNTLLAAVVGLLLATGGIFGVEALDDTIKLPEELARRHGLAILGVIAYHDAAEGAPITATQPRSPVAEAFRALRTNIQYASVDRPLHKVLITSPTPSEGKSTIAANLGIVLAQGGLRVTLIDADMRRPTIHKVLGTSNRLGLSSLFVQSPLHLNGSIQHTEMKNLGVLASGRLPPNPSELLGSRKMYEILDQIQAVCDIVLIDTPPVLSVTDAVVLAPFVDGVVLVIKPGATKVAAFKQAVERLRQVNARLLGVVVNVVGTNRTYYSYYYRNYYYKGYDEYTAEDGTKKKVKIKPEPVEVEPAQLAGIRKIVARLEGEPKDE